MTPALHPVPTACRSRQTVTVEFVEGRLRGKGAPEMQEHGAHELAAVPDACTQEKRPDMGGRGSRWLPWKG